MEQLFVIAFLWKALSWKKLDNTLFILKERNIKKDTRFMMRMKGEDKRTFL